MLCGIAEKRLARLADLTVEQLWGRFDRVNLLKHYPGRKQRAAKHTKAMGYTRHESNGDNFSLPAAKQAASQIQLGQYTLAGT